MDSLQGGRNPAPPVLGGLQRGEISCKVVVWLVAGRWRDLLESPYFLVTGEEVLWANYRVSWASFLQREKISKEPKLRKLRVLCRDRRQPLTCHFLAME
eukprot:scaffold2236_cov152-Skeletonema_menzelii.AAC.30